MSASSNAVEIRPLRPEDREAWEDLWQGYQTFYKVSLPPAATQVTWQRIHDPAEPVHGLAALVDGKMVGIVHYIFHRSTWSVGDYCYLQDLYTAEAARRRGAGQALIEAVYEKAQAHGASRVYWLTHETNTVAQSLYDKVAVRSGFVQYRRVF